jgi:hypothetical protein
MTVDLPPAERRALGVSDDQVAELRQAVHLQGPAMASRLVPEAVTRRYAIAGDRDEVVERLKEARQLVRPELIAFGAHEYTTAFVHDVAAIATAAGIEPAWALPQGLATISSAER